MKALIQAIGPIQIVFQPIFLCIVIYLIYRTLKKNDKPAGLALYLGLVIIVDVYIDRKSTRLNSSHIP